MVVCRCLLSRPPHHRSSTSTRPFPPPRHVAGRWAPNYPRTCSLSALSARHGSAQSNKSEHDCSFGSVNHFTLTTNSLRHPLISPGLTKILSIFNDIKKEEGICLTAFLTYRLFRKFSGDFFNVFI